MIDIGELSLWVALLMATWAAVVSFAGGALGRRDLVASGERAIYATLAMVALAALGLWAAIFSHDFSIKYVASFTTANLPTAYLFSALWAGQSGSLLFSSLILAACGAIAVFTKRTGNRIAPFVSGTIGVVLVVLLATTCFIGNPYERLDWMPPEGRGMNPLLQNPAMLIQPPSLYVGYLATAVPFAYAVAALISRALDAEWLAAVKRWALIAWFFTTTGILLGMWWAYIEPDWGGNWAWAPVEQAWLHPWLLNTSLLLSLTLQERRGVLGKWNVEAVVVTFLVAIFGIFAPRGGIVAEVRSFAQSPMGAWIGGLLLIAAIASAFLVAARLNDMTWTVEPGSVSGKRVRYGDYVVFIGILAMAAGFFGLTVRKQYNVSLKPGESRELSDAWGKRWRFVNQGVSSYTVLNREVTAIALDASRNGKPAGVITSEKRVYVDSRGVPTFRPFTEAGIKSSLLGDVYVVLAGVRGDDTADLRVAFNPLVRWVWIGGALLAIGGPMMMMAHEAQA